MDWDDGKEFGELKWRKRKGAFDKEHYPIDHISQMKALRLFLDDISPDNFYSCNLPDAKIKCSSKGGTQVFALYSLQPGTMMGWVFMPQDEAEFEREWSSIRNI